MLFRNNIEYLLLGNDAVKHVEKPDNGGYTIYLGKSRPGTVSLDDPHWSIKRVDAVNSENGYLLTETWAEGTRDWRFRFSECERLTYRFFVK